MADATVGPATQPVNNAMWSVLLLRIRHSSWRSITSDCCKPISRHYQKSPRAQNAPWLRFGCADMVGRRNGGECSWLAGGTGRSYSLLGACCRSARRNSAQDFRGSLVLLVQQLRLNTVGLQQNGTVSVTEKSGWRELLPEGVIR